MTAAPRFILPFQTVISSAGVPLPGALLEFFLEDTDTHSPTYSDAELTVPNLNPVPALSNGMFPAIFLNPAITYKVRLSDRNGVEIWTAYPVTALSLFYPVAFELLGGSPEAGEEIGRHYMPVAVTFPAGFSGSGGSCRLPPTSDLECVVAKQDGTAVGTMTVDSGGTFSFTTDGNTAKGFDAGETLVVTAPTVAVAGMADAAFTFVGITA